MQQLYYFYKYEVVVIQICHGKQDASCVLSMSSRSRGRGGGSRVQKPRGKKGKKQCEKGKKCPYQNEMQVYLKAHTNLAILVILVVKHSR